MSEIQEVVWGFIDDGVVTNIAVIYDLQVVAEHKQRHEDVIRLDELNPVPGKGWLYDKKMGFRPPRPFHSWQWENDVWNAPTPQPEQENSENFIPYEWDEENLAWFVPEDWLQAQAEKNALENNG